MMRQVEGTFQPSQPHACLAGKPAEPKLAQRAKAGGAEGIRTPDLRSAIAALSQLSYGPAAGTNRPKSASF
jgi:hypothetical protein